jgi:hypothetical protein
VITHVIIGVVCLLTGGIIGALISMAVLGMAFDDLHYPGTGEAGE